LKVFVLFIFESVDRSHVYVTYRDQDREQQTPSGKSWEWRKCTNRDTAQKIGLELCGEFAVPKCGSGSVGAAVARVYINKLDTYKGLHFDASYLQSAVRNVTQFRMLITDCNYLQYFPLVLLNDVVVSFVQSRERESEFKRLQNVRLR
jgi:hypothetical protein